MLIGYARVSTADQQIEIQTDALKEAGVQEDYLFWEHVSGAKAKRPELEMALRMCREGDTFVVVKLDRLARSMPELYRIMDRLDRMGVDFLSLTDNIDTKTPAGKLLFGILGSIAEFERSLIVERTMAGLKKAREKGRRGGRKPKLTEKQVKMIIKAMQDQSLTTAEIAENFGVHESTIYRAIQRYNEPAKAKELTKALKDRKRAEKVAEQRQAEKVRKVIEAED